MRNGIRAEPERRYSGKGRGVKKRRERSAVKTRQMPDKVLVFCPLHAKRDPKKTGGAGGSKNNPKSAKHLLLTAAERGTKTDARRAFMKVLAAHTYILKKNE